MFYHNSRIAKAFLRVWAPHSFRSHSFGLFWLCSQFLRIAVSDELAENVSYVLNPPLCGIVLYTQYAIDNIWINLNKKACLEKTLYCDLHTILIELSRCMQETTAWYLFQWYKCVKRSSCELWTNGWKKNCLAKLVNFWQHCKRCKSRQISDQQYN